MTIPKSEGETSAPASEVECLNCSARLSGPYCAECGQRHREGLDSVTELCAEAIGDLFSYDARLWRSLRPLLFRPGFLTREYLAGRRSAYIPPFRLFLAFSVFYFMLSSAASLSPYRAQLLDPNVPDRELSYADRGLRREAEVFVSRFPELDPTVFFREFSDVLPTMVMLMLPIAALILLGVHRRSGIPYLGHLIFCLHAHAFVFACLFIAQLIRVWTPAPALVKTLAGVSVPVAAAIYVLLGQRTVYENRSTVALLKFGVGVAGYVLLLSFVITATFRLTVWKM